MEINSLTMANKTIPDDLRETSKSYFELAKRWWWLGIFGKLLVFFVGIGSALLAFFPIYALLFCSFLEMASEFFLYRSDNLKDDSEALLRKLDMRDSFGWPISSAELSDLEVKKPSGLNKLAPPETAGENYFASKTSLGPKKALENVQESAWWSKHLAKRMFDICLAISIGICILSVVTLIISIQAIDDKEKLINIGRIVTSILMLFFITLGIYRRVIGYYEFNQKCSQIEKDIEMIIQQNKFDESDAIKIMHEYQLYRSHSPLIPSFIWKQMRSKLNTMREKYRQQPVP